jgi:hypothetical protein
VVREVVPPSTPNPIGGPTTNPKGFIRPNPKRADEPFRVSSGGLGVPPLLWSKEKGYGVGGRPSPSL